MTILDNQAHRQRWLMNVRHIQAEITDLMTDIDIAIGGGQAKTVEELLIEGDVHCALSIRELDTAADSIGRLP